MKVRFITSLTLLSLVPAQALAWDWFRSENEQVKEGNALLSQGNAEAALEAYDSAAKRLPGEAGVHLDRGLALLASGKTAEAREAFRVAAEGNAAPSVRAQAQYDLGVSFLQEADAFAEADDLDGAQKGLREAVDAFKSSLRTQPGNRDAAWNLEVAKRRLVDIEQKQEQRKQDQQNQDQDQQNQDKDQQNQDKDQQNQDKDQQNQDQDQQNQDGESKDQDPQQKDAEPNDPNKQDQPPQNDGQEQDEDEAQKSPNQPKDEPESAPEPEQPQQEAQPSAQQEANQGPDALPEHMRQALDSLADGEENLQKHQAGVRAQRRPRRIEKDW